jgi:hypothetical protein
MSGWDDHAVFSANVSGQLDDDDAAVDLTKPSDITRTKVLSKFRQFLRTNEYQYRETLQANYNQREDLLEVDLLDLRNFDADSLQLLINGA